MGRKRGERGKWRIADRGRRRLARFNCDLTKLRTHTQTYMCKHAHTQTHLATLIFGSGLTKIHLIPWKPLERVCMYVCVCNLCERTSSSSICECVRTYECTARMIPGKTAFQCSSFSLLAGQLKSFLKHKAVEQL